MAFKPVTFLSCQESAIELIFAAFFTTASASTSLILLLLKHPSAIEKIRQELVSHELYPQHQNCPMAPCPGTGRDSEQQLLTTASDAHEDQLQLPDLTEETELGGGCSPNLPALLEPMHPPSSPQPRGCRCPLDISLEQLSRLRYLDCVVKEVLRVLPPVSGGYRTALQTFELDVSACRKGRRGAAPRCLPLDPNSPLYSPHRVTRSPRAGA